MIAISAIIGMFHNPLYTLCYRKKGRREGFPSFPSFPSLGDAISWEKEWERVTQPFRTAFAKTPEDEVERDLSDTLAKVRRERN